MYNSLNNTCTHHPILNLPIWLPFFHWMLHKVQKSHIKHHLHHVHAMYIYLWMLVSHPDPTLTWGRQSSVLWVIFGVYNLPEGVQASKPIISSTYNFCVYCTFFWAPSSSRLEQHWGSQDAASHVTITVGIGMHCYLEVLHKQKSYVVHVYNI